tara:strand:- start:465 stop:599 length:135 start_codon:yes stop_codon:yes gene_type:complete
MAKRIEFQFKETKKQKRKGIHAKSKTSKIKTSKNYRKKYRGQGR